MEQDETPVRIQERLLICIQWKYKFRSKNPYKCSIIGGQAFDPCPLFFFFSLPKRLPAAALQGWNSFGEVVGKRMKRVLFRGKWSMVFENECTFSREYRQEMLYCGLYLKCSHAVHHCWRGEREGRSGIVSSRARTISINRCVVSGYVCSFPFFFFFLFPIDRMADRTGRFGRVETGDDTFEI